MRCHLISISYENAHCAPSMSFQRPFVGRYNREYHSRRHNDFGWWKKTWPYTVFICHSFPRQSKQTHALFYIRHSSVICMATECWGGPASQPLQISSGKKIIQEKIKINWENNTRPNKWTDDKKYQTHSTHQTKSRAHNRKEIKYEFRKAKDEFLKENFFRGVFYLWME